MMSVLEWKLFDFIKLLPIKTPNKYKNLYNNRQFTDGTTATATSTTKTVAIITSTCYNDVYQVLCDAKGAINIYSNEWDFTFYQMKGHPIQLSTITDNNVLITLEQDTVNYNLELRLYNLNKMMKRHQVVVLSKVNLECSCEATVIEAIFIDSTPMAASSVVLASSSASAFTSSLLVIVIGLSNGCILLYKGPIMRDLSMHFRHLYVCTKPIKGIKFIYSKVADYTKMFICTDNTVKCFTLSASNNSNSSSSNTAIGISIGIGGITSGNLGGSGSSASAAATAIAETKIVLDNTFGAVYCCTTYRYGDGDNDYYFIVGRDDALYCYTADGRGPCFAIEGRKQLLEWYDNGKHLICILSMDNHHHHQQQSNELLTNERENLENCIIIIDIENKLIMLNEKLDDGILCILPIDESHTNCYIILKNLQFLTLRERSIQSKLRLLYNKNLYDIALKVICAANGNKSRNSNTNSNTNSYSNSNSYSNYLATTYAKYGDYMLQRGDYKSAIKLYIQSINGQSVSASVMTIESSSSPFSIIMKLMNLNQKDYLIEYLNALINSTKEQSPAKVRHMELLKNCLKRQQINRKIDEIFDYIHNQMQIIKTDKTDNLDKADQISDNDNDNNINNKNRSNNNFNYYPIELINLHHDDATNKTIHKVLLNLPTTTTTTTTTAVATADKNQLSELLHKKNKTDVINFLQKYGTLIMLKYPQVLCETLCNGCLGDGGKIDNVSFRQYILPILIHNRKMCVKEFPKFKQYFDCSSTAAPLYNIWLECILLEWQQQQNLQQPQQQLTVIQIKDEGKGGKTEDKHELIQHGEEGIHIDTKYVLDFLKLYRNCFYDNDILIICRHFDFWPGIIWTFMNMRNGHGNLMQMYYLFKNSQEIFSNENDFNANAFLNRNGHNNDNDNDNDVAFSLSLHALSNEKDLFQKSSHLIQFILTTMFSNNRSNNNSIGNSNNVSVMYPEFMLKTLQHLFSVENLQMSHIIEHLSKEKLSMLLMNRNVKDDITKLNQQLNERYQLLLNYQKKPIEYRGDLCEICKQPIKLPATFYLCQHSYHKECYAAHTKGNSTLNIGGGGVGEDNIKQKCVKCQRQRELKLLNKYSDNVDIINPNNNDDTKIFNNDSTYCDILTRSAMRLSNGIFYKLNDGENRRSNINRLNEKNTNPFLDGDE